MDVFDLEAEAQRLGQPGKEIAHRLLVERPEYLAGVAVFRAAGALSEGPAVRKEIAHPDLDVVAQILQGSGTLAVAGERHPLRPGMLFRLPAGTPHDFAADAEGLVLFYVLIRVRSS